MKLIKSLLLLFCLAISVTAFSQEIEEEVEVAPKPQVEKEVPPPPPPPPPPVTEADEEPVYKVVENMPRFPGCEDKADKALRKKCANDAMNQFLGKNIKYPPEARKNGTSGTVIVQFVVAKDGQVKDAKVLKDIGDGCGNEALRIVGLLPDFIPGTQRGKSVNVAINLPIRFRVN